MSADPTRQLRLLLEAYRHLRQVEQLVTSSTVVDDLRPRCEEMRELLERRCAALLDQVQWGTADGPLLTLIREELSAWPVPVGELTRREMNGLVGTVTEHVRVRLGLTGDDRDHARRKLVILATEFAIDVAWREAINAQRQGEAPT